MRLLNFILCLFVLFALPGLTADAQQRFATVAANGWRTATPESQGVDSALLAEALQRGHHDEGHKRAVAHPPRAETLDDPRIGEARHGQRRGGRPEDEGKRFVRAEMLADQLLRADHRIHVRCEICADDVLTETENVISSHRVDLISLMDHTPGARQ